MPAHRRAKTTPPASPATEIHRFWTTPEIVQGVFSAFTRSNEDLAALASMARTSKFLSEPALNVLWAHLDTTKPLWYCLGRDVWDVSRRSAKLVSHWRTEIQLVLTRIYYST